MLFIILFLVIVLFISIFTLNRIYKKQIRKAVEEEQRKSRIQTANRTYRHKVEQLLNTMYLLNIVLANKYNTEIIIEILEQQLQQDLIIRNIVVELYRHVLTEEKGPLREKADALYKTCSRRAAIYFPYSTIVNALGGVIKNTAEGKHGICVSLKNELGYNETIHIFPELRANSSFLKKYQANTSNTYWWDLGDPQRVACVKELREIYFNKMRNAE